MEPLKPTFREALKNEHRGLTDETIDEIEDLIAQRFLIDPEEDPLAIQELDRRREELLRAEMPKAEQVLQRERAKEQGEG